MESFDYEKQGRDFLEGCGVKITVERSRRNGCPLWCDGKHIHGNAHDITFSRNLGRGTHEFNVTYWNSKHDAEHEKTKLPTAYDVLSCLVKDDPGTFVDFCAAYGYNQNEPKALKTYVAVQNEWGQVSTFFTSEELEELREIY